MYEGYPAGPAGLVTNLPGLRLLTVRENSRTEISPVNGQPIDKFARSRFWRVAVPIWTLLMLGNLIWTIAIGGDVISASILLAGALLWLIRLRWPRDTWPAWLFSYKP
jgi:hypothetical protein